MIEREMAVVGGSNRPLAFLLRLGPPRAGFSFRLLTARPVPQLVHSPLDRIETPAQVEARSRRREGNQGGRHAGIGALCRLWGVSQYAHDVSGSRQTVGWSSARAGVVRTTRTARIERNMLASLRFWAANAL